MSLPEQQIHMNHQVSLPLAQRHHRLWRSYKIMVVTTAICCAHLLLSFLSHICLFMSRLMLEDGGKAFQNVSKVEFRWRCIDTLPWLDPTMSGLMETLKLCLAWCKMTLLTVTTRPWPGQLEWKIAQKLTAKRSELLQNWRINQVFHVYLQFP